MFFLSSYGSIQQQNIAYVYNGCAMYLQKVQQAYGYEGYWYNFMNVGRPLPSISQTRYELLVFI